MATVYGIEVAGETYGIEDTDARQGVQTNATDIDDIQAVVPSSASASNKLATQDDVPDISSLETDVENIQAVMPASATAQNKLATNADLPQRVMVASMGDIRNLANNKLYQLIVSTPFNVSNEAGISTQIPALAQGILYKINGDMNAFLSSYYPSVGGWVLFFNSNGQNRGQKVF